MGTIPAPKCGFDVCQKLLIGCTLFRENVSNVAAVKEQIDHKTLRGVIKRCLSLLCGLLVLNYFVDVEKFGCS